MGRLRAGNGEFVYQLASDVGFNGIRLEVLTIEGDVWFDVSLPEEGELSVNTFSNDVPHEVVLAAIALIGRR